MTGDEGNRDGRQATAAVEDDVFITAVEMNRVPMVLTDPALPDNPMIFANQAYFDLTGYRAEEVYGRNCRFMQGPKTDPATVRTIRDAVRAHRPVSVEILNHKRDGTPFWNALFIGPIFGREGSLRYFFASVFDITPRRIEDRALRQAQKMEAVGQLTAGLAHDFNNLLQIVAGNLETAMEEMKDNARGRRALENASLAVRQGARLTQQLLTFARKQRLEPRPVDLNALLMECRDILVRTLGTRALLEFRLDPRAATCLVDPVYLEMALLNVLMNARDAMPDGGRVVVATGSWGESPGAAAVERRDFVAVSVADDGGGMPSDVLQHATEPFFTTKPPGQGTGLGLAMVHGFVQQSHGRLDIESEPGKGTVVRLLLPAAASTRPEEAQEEAPLVLAVDDSEDIRTLVELHLSALGYRVVLAASGEEALDVLDRTPAVRLLFTDLAMPGGMNGLTLIRRAKERRPDLAVLMTTAYADDFVTEEDEGLPANLLVKPFRRVDLADRVRAALGDGSV
ncbi:response regulator [Azospirillum sp. RWY-5-1]|uniref:histidine kinase n=1 Tax=Azospirillum oleiclasticum TaxID=2735135 RepID=A0ABX2T537_9PROT|nr:response regulator [Azospirillum oleiclasticum]NYZ19329.1 response regulator [Azospirillum oleiclasticum]